MAVLITGGAGFIGSNLAKHYSNLNEFVIVVDNFFRGSIENLKGLNKERLLVVTLDMTAPEAVDELSQLIELHKPRKIFHYAAINGTEHFYDHPSLTQKTNSMGTQVLVDAISNCTTEDYRPLLVFASTSENYGSAETVPTSESDLTYVNIESVRDSYAVAKLNSEFAVRYTAEAGGYDFLILRIFNVYGPNMVGGRYGQVIPEFIQRLASGEHPLKILGTGEETRSFCYIDDHISLTTLLVENENSYNNVINLGNPIEVTISELARIVLKAFNCQLK